jgi:tetratricopeptide (TPR) repeat protein
MDDFAMSLRFARHFDEALPEYENLLEYYPDEFWGKYGLLHCYVRLGRKTEAEAALAALKNSPYEFGYWDFLILGDRSRVQGVVRELLQLIEEKGERHVARDLARHFAWLGEGEQALAWLKVASEEFPHTLKLNILIQEFDFLRSEPEFMDCLRKAGFTEEMVAASKALTSDKIVGDS